MLLNRIAPDLPPAPVGPANHQSESYRTGNDPRVLRELATPSVGIVTWSRGCPADVESSLLLWGRTAEPDFEQRISTDSYSLASAFRGLDEATRAWMLEDVALLIAHFSAVAQTTELKMAFGPIRSDRCRKFHRDNLRHRLVCTYAGPGTEWVPGESVNESVLRRPPICPEEANRKIVRHPDAVQRASAADVLMMKGGRHPDGTRIVHRSPPIERFGATRVVLVLSTVEED